MLSITLAKLMSELSLYFALAQFIGTPMGSSGSLLGASALMAAAGALGRAIDRGGHPRLRWLALALLIPAFRMARCRADVFLMILPAAYVICLTARRMGDGDYYGFLEEFRLGVKLVGGASALMLVFWMVNGSAERILPHVLAQLVCGVLALRMLRQTGEMRGDARLRAYNFISVGGLCVAGALASSPAVLGAVKAALGFVYEHTVVPMLMLLAYAMGGLMSLLWRALHFEPSETAQEEMRKSAEQAQEWARQFQPAEVNELPSNILLAALVLICFAALAVLLFRFLRRPRQQRQNAVREARQFVEGLRDPRGRLLDRSPAARVRAAYRKFMGLCADWGADIRPSDTTADIDALARAALIDPPRREQLRDAYRRARYGQAATDADADAADEALKAIRAHARGLTKLTRRS